MPAPLVLVNPGEPHTAIANALRLAAEGNHVIEFRCTNCMGVIGSLSDEIASLETGIRTQLWAAIDRHRCPR